MSLEACAHEINRLEAEIRRLRSLYNAATEFAFRRSTGGLISVVKDSRSNFYRVLDVNGDALPDSIRMGKDEAIAKAMTLTGAREEEREDHV